MMQEQEEETKSWTRIAVPLELIREVSMCRSWHRAQRREETGKLLDSQPSMRQSCPTPSRQGSEITAGDGEHRQREAEFMDDCRKQLLVWTHSPWDSRHETRASSSLTESQHTEGRWAWSSIPLAEEVGALVGDGRERETVDLKTVAHGSHPGPAEGHTSENVRGYKLDLMDIKRTQSWVGGKGEQKESREGWVWWWYTVQDSQINNLNNNS